MDAKIPIMASNEEALAVQIFENFCAASTMGKILALFREMCRILKLKPTVMPEFYTKLKLKLAKSWRAQAIFKKLDVRSNFKIYNRGRTCANCRVLIVGGGPCGLRTAIDAQLLGAKVVVIEKRDRMTRNNIVHLWPFVIQDLRNLAAKKFFGKFCAGSIDHISIRQLQFILLKVALILGVELHEGVGFESILEPKDTGNEKFGWRAFVTPADHPVSNYEFDVLIGADGKRNTLQGFKRKEFRGKLAIAITANFINKHTKEEAAVPEISGTAFIFKQKFFLDLNKQYYIDLENLVYYKGETHYFVMTAKKQSLLQRNVLMQDYSETASLLSRENINYAALREYALDAAYYATNFQLSKLEFAINHYGQPDVAVFDFTSMYAAENACRAIERHGQKLLVCLVGDGLLEPFWPTGSGCARGFLSSLDACWALRSWAMGIHPLAIIAERESTYRLLAQTTPQNVAPDFSHYTVDPATRYRNLNKNAVMPHQVVGFFDTDDPNKQNIDILELTTTQVHTKKRKRDSQVHPETLLVWIRKQVSIFNLEIDNLLSPFKNGLVLCAVLNRYRPDLIDIAVLDSNNLNENLKVAFEIFEKEFGILKIPNIEEIIEKNDNADRIIIITYLSHIYYLFRGEIPFIRHSKTGSPEPEKKRSSIPRNSANREPGINISDITTRPTPQMFHKTSDSENVSSQKKSRKRRSSNRYHGQSVVERMKKLRDKKHHEEQKKRDIARSCLMARLEAKSLKMLESNCKPQSSVCIDEDYNISSYRQNAPEFKTRVKDLEKLLYPEPERSAGTIQKSGLPGEFSSRIKTIEDQITEGSSAVVNKKPRDLLRAIGKIETTDWNFKQIEDKIQENQLGRPPAHGKEKVPKWNREQFLARQTKIVGHGVEQQEMGAGKFHDIDSTIKQLDRQLKEGKVLETGERGKNKVASLAGQFTKKNYDEEQPISKTNNNVKQLKVNPTKLDICHTCKKKVYLMEKICPEDSLTFHKTCFKCHYCSLTLKVGSYTYDRDGKYGNHFFCQHHFGLGEKVAKPTTVNLTKVQTKERKPELQYPSVTVPDSLTLDSKSTIQVLNRDETPERIELENQTNDPSLREEPCDEMDEDEWSDINFGNSFANENESSGNGDGEESSSNDEEFSEAIDDGQDESDDDIKSDDSQGSDVGSDGDFSTGSSDRFSYHEYSSGDEEGGSGTEGSEQRVAREQRRQEVAISAPPLTSSPTDTEVASDEESSSETSEAANSATEVSTDSEFAHDDQTPTREIPAITFNDKFICKYRGQYSKHAEDKKVQVPKKKIALDPSKDKSKTSGVMKVHVKTKVIVNGNTEKKDNVDIHLELKNIMPAETKTPVCVPRPGDYLLSRTQSTSGIATKRALELKKKYLLGPQASVGLQKSDSASQLDSKFRTFHSNISECQKLLNPAPDISPSMQAFLENSSKRNGGLLSPTNMNLLPANPFPSNPIKDKIQPYNSGTSANTNSCNNNSDIYDAKNDNVESNSKKTTLLTSNNDKNNTISNAVVVDTKCQKDTNNTKELIIENSVGKHIQSRSPVLETSIMVPNIPWKKTKTDELSGTDMESDSLLTSDSSSDDPSSKDGQGSLAIPRVEIRKPCGEVMQLDSLMIVDGKYIGSQESEEENPDPVPNTWPSENNQIIETVNSQISSESLIPESVSMFKSDGHTSPNSDSGNDITAFFTDNEALDWAVDGTAIDIECNTNLTGQSQSWKPLGAENTWEKFLLNDYDVSEHVCGKGADKKPNLSPPNILACDHSDIDFMDTGSEESLIENLASSKNRESLVNRGFVEFVEIGMNDSVIDPVKTPVIEAINPHCDSPVNDRSMDFIEQGACVLNNDTYLRNFFKEKILVKYPHVYKEVEDEENNQLILKNDVDLRNSAEDVLTKEHESTLLNKDKTETSTDCDEINLTNNNQSDSIFVFKEIEHNENITSNDSEAQKISESEDLNLHRKSCNSPKTSRRLEEISKEKVKQKDVIHQLVMDRMSKNTTSSFEKRMNRRSRSSANQESEKKISLSPSNTDNHKSKSELDSLSEEANKVESIVNDKKKYLFKSDIKLKTLNDESVENKDSLDTYLQDLNPSLISSKIKHSNNSETFSLPDLPHAVRQECSNANYITKNSNLILDSERTILHKENCDLPASHTTGIVPGFRQLSLDDCSGKLVQHVTSLRKTDTFSNNDPINIQSASYSNLYSNDYTLFNPDNIKKSKNRDSERRKSIIKTVSDFFKRRDSAGQLTNIFGEKKNRLQKDKYKSKEHCPLDESGTVANVNSDEDVTPPPIPPLPTNIGQFSGEAEKQKDFSANHSKTPCLLAFERNEKIKKIRSNIKILKAKEIEIKKKYEDLIMPIRKKKFYPNRQVLIHLTNIKRQLRMVQFQHQMESFLAEDLLLEDKYFELRLKLTKILHSKHESCSAKMINKDMMDIVSSRRILGDKLRDLTSRYHSKEAEEDLAKHEFSSNSKDLLDKSK